MINGTTSDSPVKIEDYMKIRKEIGQLEALEYRLDFVENEIIREEPYNTKNKELLAVLIMEAAMCDENAISDVFATLTVSVKKALREKKLELVDVLNKGLDVDAELNRVRSTLGVS